MTFSDCLEGMYEADAKIERESVSELLASGDDLFKKIDVYRDWETITVESNLM